MPTSLQRMTGIAVNLEAGVADRKNYFLTIKSKAMNTNQKDPGCCTTNSGCCGITEMGCC